VIFCRNVLIYFDEETIKNTIDKMVDSLNVGGYIFFGHSDGARVSKTNLKRVSHAVFQKI